MQGKWNVDKLHIHGISDVVTVEAWRRVLWIVALLVAVALVLIQCSTLSMQYASEPTVTYAENREKEDQFPSVMVCPTIAKRKYPTFTNFTWGHRIDYNDGTPPQIKVLNDTGGLEETSPYWIEWSKVQNQLGIVQNKNYQVGWHWSGIKYPDSLEPLNFIRGIVEQNGLDEKTWNTVADFYWDFTLGKNMSLTEKKLLETVDFDVVITEVEGHRLKNKRKEMTGYGVCYAFEIEPASVDNASLILGRQRTAQFSLRRSDADVAFNGVFIMEGELANSDVMFIGDTSFYPKSGSLRIPQYKYMAPDETHGGPMTYEVGIQRILSMPIVKDFNITLYVTSVTFNRLNLRRRPCRDWSEQDRSICMVQCFNDEFCSKIPRPCLLFHPNQTKEEQFKRLCSYAEGKNVVYDQESDHCLPRAWTIPPEGNRLNVSVPNELCENRCPQRCKERIFYFTRSVQETRTYYVPWLNRPHSFEVHNSSDGILSRVPSTHWANITLRFHDNSRRFELSERLESSGYEFAAEFGSAIALWTGASGLAIAQIAMLLFSSAVRK